MARTYYVYFLNFISASLLFLDNEGLCIQVAHGIAELPLYPGDCCVKHGLRFCAEGLNFVFPEIGITKRRFPGVYLAKLFPVNNQVIGYYSFRVVQKQVIQSPFNRIEVDLCLIIRERDATIPFYDEPAAFRESMYSVLDSRVIQTTGMQFGHK